MKLAIAGDHAGQPLVSVLFDHLTGIKGLTVTDLSSPKGGLGEYYANLADRVANAVLADKYQRAILVCGTGIGMCICANKVPGIYAALTHDTYSATRAALSNNARIITMGARVIGPELAKSIVDAWLPLGFDTDGASGDNIVAVDALDAKYRKRS